jgi:sugar lactone lactonase YvrE
MPVGFIAASAFASISYAQQSYPCVNDAPTPYHVVDGWADTPRHFVQPVAVGVDSHDNVWVFDRCEKAGCSASSAEPIFELSSSGKTLRNFGAGLFVFPHAVAVDKVGSIWLVDGDVKDGRGNQVIKFSSDGKELMRLGKAGQGKGSKALDTFDQPTGVAIASNGDVFISEGHFPSFGNSRIMKFDKNGKFIKTFATFGPGDGQLQEPHGIALDSHDRLYVADRRNFRVDVFDKDGKFLAAWKQFGDPSGLAVKNDVLYVADSHSSDDPKNPAFNGCKGGIRIGSVKDGKVTAFIPPPVSADNLPPAEGIAVDSQGNVYAGFNQQNDVRKYVKK